MTTVIPPFPKVATVREMHEYYGQHVKEGRGEHVAMARMMCFSIPPLGHDTHDDQRCHVYTNLIPE